MSHVARGIVDRSILWLALRPWARDVAFLDLFTQHTDLTSCIINQPAVYSPAFSARRSAPVNGVLPERPAVEPPSVPSPRCLESLRKS